ncbi:MAG: METTL5 family protein [Candidatus Nanoarchaeia archaeon]|nr:METTL5 family protein [Candidatus Nanoarchaeia archaeon]
MNKKELEIILSKLKDYSDKKPSLEQYITPSKNAADLLWSAYMNADIQGKIIIDAGCGNGILGIGALLLGAKKAIFIDIDKKAIMTAEENLKALKLKNFELINSDIFDLDLKADVLITNPPFGVQNAGRDVDFLMKCSQLSDKIYLIYKGDGLKILKKNFPDKNIEIIKSDELLLKKQFTFHTKDKAKTKIILARIS